MNEWMDEWDDDIGMLINDDDDDDDDGNRPTMTI